MQEITLKDVLEQYHMKLEETLLQRLWQIDFQKLFHLGQKFFWTGNTEPPCGTILRTGETYLINTSTLKEIFKAVYGQPIATYMKEFRVRQAMKLLRETNATIADIASQVGYQTQGKFSSAFQSIVKMSPREYRKIQGKAPSDSFSKTL